LAATDDSRETALNYIEEAEHLAASTQPYDPWMHAHVLWQKAYLKLCLGFEDQAYEIADMSIQIGQSSDRWSVSGYWVMGLVSLRKKNFPQARHHLENALEMCLEVDDRLGVALSLSFLGTYHHRVGNFSQAYLCYKVIFTQYSLLVGTNFYGLEKFGLLLVDSQAPSQTLEIPPAWIDAVQLFSASEHWKHTAFLFWSLELEFESYPQVLEHLKTTIEPETFQTAWAMGKTLAESIGEAAKFALSVGKKYTFQDRL